MLCLCKETDFWFLFCFCTEKVPYGMMKYIGWCRMELHQSIPRKDGIEEITIIDPRFVEWLNQ